MKISVRIFLQYFGIFPKIRNLSQDSESLEFRVKKSTTVIHPSLLPLNPDIIVVIKCNVSWARGKCSMVVPDSISMFHYTVRWIMYR